MAVFWEWNALSSSIVAIIICFVLVIILKLKRPKPKDLPPGPRGWPLVGWIRFIFAEKPTKLLLNMKNKYGNVFGFHVGTQYCVTLSDFSSVKEGFNNKFLQSRPPKYLRTSADCINLSEMEKENWENQRGFLSNSLRVLGVGRNRFEEVIHDELSRAIPKMESFVGKPECNLRDVLKGSVNNTIFQMVCSRWFEDDHPIMNEFMKYLELIALSFCNNASFLYFPWLDGLLRTFHPYYKAIDRSCKTIGDFVRSEIASRKAINDETSDHDYIDLYLNEMKSGNVDPNFFKEDHLVTNCLLIMMASTDTTRSTLEWLLMAMAHYPHIQEKVYQEIVSAIGPEKTPLSADRPSLPYTEATALESERWMTLLPLNCLRWASEDTVIQGFKIPKNTVIINNLKNCHSDPKYWKSPKDFNPERFLSKDKSRVIIPEYFMPFSIGKRNCPGDKMAGIAIFIYFTRMMQKFKFFPPEGGVCFKALHTINKQAIKPFVRVELR